jgi:hypothetical protein
MENQTPKCLRLINSDFSFFSPAVDVEDHLSSLCASIDCPPALEPVDAVILLLETVDKNAIDIAARMKESGKFEAFIRESGTGSISSGQKIACEYISSRYAHRSWLYDQPHPLYLEIKLRMSPVSE